MNNTETNTTQLTTLFHSLVLAITGHDRAAEVVHKAYINKIKALESIRSLGYKDMQSGKDKDTKPMAGFFPYSIAKAEFEAAFLIVFKAKNGADATPSQGQIDNRIKQDISSAKGMLQTGKFISNMGRETPKKELDHAISIDAAASMAAFTAKLLASQAGNTVKVLAKESADIKKQVVKAFESAAFVSALTSSTPEQKQAEQDKAEALAEQAMVAEQKAADAVKADVKAKADAVKADAVKADAKAKVESAKAKVESKTTKIKMVAVDAVKSDGKPELASVDRILKNAVDNLTETEIKELIMKLQAYIA